MKNKSNKPNILVKDKAEFFKSLDHYFRHEKKLRDETHVGLQILFTINGPVGPDDITTTFVAKIVDRDVFNKFYKNRISWNETFSFKGTDCETLEELNEYLAMELKLQNISDKEYQITKSIRELVELLDDEVLKFASNEPDFWMGAIGHIKRKVSLYAETIPTFEVLEPQKSDVRTDEEIVAEFREMLKKALEDNLHPEYDKILTMNRDGTITTKFEKKTDRFAPIIHHEATIPDINYTREEWEERIREHAEKIDQDLIFDEEIISLAKGFMVGPLTAQRGKAIAATTMRFDSLEELKESITKLAQEKDMFMYLMMTIEQIIGGDSFTITEEERAALPRVTRYLWRGEFLDKQ